MCETGDRWQVQLAAHFGALAGRRASGRAVFGLEHGLEPRAFDEVESLVRRHVRSVTERRNHWLLWIVYASELGYRYAGDEYWQTFGRETPGWDDGSRGWIREIFRKFHKEFGGPKPTGAWAETFTIIAWPITNALLPTDLQRHLARALYEARSGLVHHLQDPEDLGRFIADNTWHGSDRFDKLTQQPLLLGQIALALLRPRAVGDEMLLRSTLQRVAQDLEKQREAAAWLKGARRSVEQPTIRTGGRAFVRAAPEPATVVERVRAFAKTSAPRVFLRQEDDGGRRWGVRLRLPYVGPLVEMSPDVRSAVMGSRCWAPAAGAPIARGRLLRESQELPLVRWPKPREPLIRFQDLSEGLEAALLDEWAMADAPWLFGVRNDGTAVELKTLQVRPGRVYIFASNTRRPVDDGRFPLLETACEGVSLRRLDVPKALTPDWIEFLRSLRLQPTRTVVVWPAGFVPAEWDGESRAQWLSSDLAMLGIRADHPVEELWCELEGVGSVTLQRLQPGSTSFLEVPALPAGSYTLRIVERNREAEQARSAITIEIRMPRLARPEQAGPLMVWVEPYSTSLEELWEGAIAICAAGMTQRHGRCTVTLAERPGGNPLAQVTATNVRFPMSAEDWRTLFRSQLQSANRMESAYDEARWAQVVLEAGGYSRYALEFDRQLSPVRWRLRDDRGSYVLELRDDTESGHAPRAQYAAFHEPDRWMPVAVNGWHAQVRAASDGGVYDARIGKRGATVIVPPSTRTLHSFQALSLKPRLSPRPRRAEALADLVETTQLWAAARLPGNVLARAWRSQVVRQLQNDLFSLLCGRVWRHAEVALRRDRSDAAYDRIQRMVVQTADDRRTVAGSLVAHPSRICSLPVEERIEYFGMVTQKGAEFAGSGWRRLAHRHGSATADWMAEFCLRAASDVHLAAWAADSLEDALDVLISWPLPARTARCLVLSSIVGTDRAFDFPPLFSGWDWSLV